MDMFVGEYYGRIHLYRNDGDSTAPVWTATGMITDSGGSTIDVGSRSNPAFVDIDDDGDMDMFVGEYYGRIHLYRNDGDSSAPVWTATGMITDSGGSAIDVGYWSSPTFVDIDNDADIDMFIGESGGRIYLYRNDGDSSAPVWISTGMITNSGGGTIDVGSYSNPAFADIDDDGDMDMFVGESGGRIYLYRNDGDSSTPVWTATGLITDLGGGTVDVGSYSNPTFVDIDNDGDMDMFVGESGGRIYLYRNDGDFIISVWTYIGLVLDSTTSTIDIGSRSSPAFADIDDDGDMDMFVGESGGRIHLYRNDGDSSAPVWTAAGWSTNSTGSTIDVGSYSSPAFVDIDDDGDMDMFVGESGGRIYLYRNDGDSSAPVWTAAGWSTNSTGSTIDVGSYSSPAFADIDDDGDMDMFVGESGGRIYLYRNDGDSSAPVWTAAGWSTNSTGCTIDVGSYSSPAFADIDNDADMDMFVGESGGRIYLYRNDGDNTAPVWPSSGILSNAGGSTIDVGSYSSPAFVDIDDDGDMDMFVGESAGRIYLYRNEGDIDAVAWMNRGIQEILTQGTIDVGSRSSPAFEDIDNDGDMDMFVGESGGRIYLYRNDGDNTAPVWRSMKLITNSGGGTIDVGSYSSPAFEDIDDDGDMDMFVGESGGRIYLYRNDGDSSAPVWTATGMITNSGGSTIDVGSYSSPAFADIDDDGDMDMFVGESGGRIYLYRNDGDSSAPVWTSTGWSTNSTGSTIDIGSRSNPTFVDIDNDADMDMFVGEYYGKIYFYRNDGDMTSPIWSFMSSNYQNIGVQYYSSPAFVDIDNDNDVDLFVGNNYGYIYSYPSLGRTSHVYTTHGIYQATLRVTDNNTLTDTDHVIISVLDSGYPTAKANANPTTGNAPLLVALKGVGNDADGVITLYEWDFDGDGTYDWSSTTSGNTTYTYTTLGTFDAMLRVTDNDGKTSTDAVTITTNLNISTSRTMMFNPTSGQTGTISSTLSADTTITIKIIDWSGNVMQTLVNNQARAAGAYSDTWDGKDDTGNLVQDGVYFFLIEYTVNGTTLQYDLREDAIFKEVTPSRGWPSSFNPFEEDFVEVTYSTSKPAEVSLYFWKRDYSHPGSSIAPVRTLFIREPRASGAHTEIWDGVDDKGAVVGPWSGGYCITLWVYELPDSAILITGQKPVITDINAEPNYFSPAYNPYKLQTNEYTIVSFNLSKTANLEVKVINSDGLIIQTISKTNLPAGANTIIWDGKDLGGNLVKEGIYSISLTAIDANGNRSLPRYAAVVIYY